MKTISPDVHAELSQLSVVAEPGEVLLEMQVPTKAEDLRRIVFSAPFRWPRGAALLAAKNPD